jgi:hypothetical protein
MTIYIVKGLIEVVFFFQTTIIPIFDGWKIALIVVEILLCFCHCEERSNLKHKRLKRIAGIASNKN